ncbi:MAG: exo-alpha-sialidase [Deltaproteobacteria bacterium]|nr:exo-alpha-sialidase [Deltaproteobacteria bacterium]MBW2719822.1 exo-alpha-sialidase [Deltaproteobacteria bacterium]
MRYLVGFMCVLALGVMGCSDGGAGPATEFEAGDAVTVSNTSPFAECTADSDPELPFYADSEVEPWLEVNPTNRNHLAASWQQDRYQKGACRGNVASVSFDGGQSWQESVVPGLGRCSGGEWDAVTDPWLTFAANGDLYHASLVINRETDTEPKRSAMIVHKSVDGGLTWGDPITVSEANDGFGEDKEAIAADPYDACSVYLVWTRYEPVPPHKLMFSRTTDCGENWEEASTIRTEIPSELGLQLVVLPNGTLFMYIVVGWQVSRAEPWELASIRSPDGGETWSEPTKIADVHSAIPMTPDPPLRIRSGSDDIAVDRRSGNLYMVWEESFREPRLTQVAFSMSTDGGLTWSPEVRLDQTPGDAGALQEQAILPSVAVSDDGTVGVTYYNFQNDTSRDGRSDTDHWFIHCHPDATECADAANWGAQIRLTEHSFDYNLAPKSGGLFLGDYVGLAAAGSDFFALPSVTTPDDPADTVLIPIRGR